MLLNCCGGVNSADGLTDGGGSWVGNPPATVLLISGELTQPAVIEENDEVVVEYDEQSTEGADTLVLG